jgi:xylan 1,4-beta-xylosidase
LDNYANPQFNANNLAEKMGNSTSFLRELVHANYGMGVHMLIETIRLEHAIKLLAADDDIIDLICHKAGYAYSKTFRTAFKNRLHLTPQECRDMIAGAENKQTEIERLLKVLWNGADKNDR